MRHKRYARRGIAPEGHAAPGSESLRGGVCDSLHDALKGHGAPMATKVEAARERLYDDDFYAWTREQAALLRARRFNALDLDHLIEAVLGVGDVQREAVLSDARVVLEHLPKLAHSSATNVAPPCRKGLALTRPPRWP